MTVSTTATARGKSNISKHHYSRCYRCGAKVYIKPVFVGWDWKVRLIPYNFQGNSQRHYCPNSSAVYDKNCQVIVVSNDQLKRSI